MSTLETYSEFSSNVSVSLNTYYHPHSGLICGKINSIMKEENPILMTENVSKTGRLRLFMSLLRTFRNIPGFF